MKFPKWLAWLLWVMGVPLVCPRCLNRGGYFERRGVSHHWTRCRRCEPWRGGW